jgi:lipopolysaccharide export system permease protein
MMPGTLARYVGLRFLGVFVVVFGGLFMMTLMIDFVEMLRRTAHLKDVSLLQIAKITFYRVPHITERIMPFAALISSMVCYLSLSRRNELVVARSAGVSAWQFVTPAVGIAFLIGVFGTTLYNPVSAAMREHAQRLDAELFGGSSSRSLNRAERGFWVRQRSPDGQSIINAKGSRLQGVELSGVTIFTLDRSDRFLARIEADRATLHEGYWRLERARVYAEGSPPTDHAIYDLKTNITRAQAQESFATPETVPFWQLSYFIRFADNAGLAAIGYRLQYYQLLALPFYLVAMVLLAASVSLRLFRFGGVQKMIMGGMAAGFLLYVLSKVAGDLSKANLLTPVAAAALPPLAGALTGLLTLLYLEDG